MVEQDPRTRWQTEIASFRDDATAMPIGIFNIHGDVLWVNRAMRTLLGMDQGNPAPLQWLRNPSFDHLKTLTPQKGPIFAGHLTAGDGKINYQSVRAKAYRKQDQILIVSEYDAQQLNQMNHEMSRLNQEISNLQRELIKEKQALERALSELSVSEGKYRRLFEGVFLGIFQCTQEGKLLRANPAFADTFGYDSPTELMQSVSDLAKDLYTDPEAFKRHADRAFEQPTAIDDETHFRRKDGSTFLAKLKKWAVHNRDDDPPYLEGYVEDIEEQKRMQTALAQARKMEAVAVLAGGIAHEFNNALGSLVGYIDLLQLSLPQETTATRYCNSMQDCSQRMAELARRLLAYAKGGKYQPRIQPFDAIVGEAVDEMQAKGTATARWRINTPPSTRSVMADAGQLKMVVSVLLENAIEALEACGADGGIDIEVLETRLDAQSAPHPSIPAGDYLKLIVGDNGCGMPPEVSERIFEPFYTTKFQGRGMGMAAAYGIIKNHNGWIFVDSAPEGGTQVQILLPAVDPPTPEKAA